MFPRELGPGEGGGGGGGGAYSLRVYGPPDRNIAPDRIPYVGYDTGCAISLLTVLCHAEYEFRHEIFCTDFRTLAIG